jgi:hypothetical protein
MMDSGMVVKWFEFCRVEDKCSTDCPYFDNTCSVRCTKELAKDVLTLLKEQKELVRCADCRHADISPSGLIKCRGIFRSREWYCADGEKADT